MKTEKSMKNENFMGKIWSVMKEKVWRAGNVNERINVWKIMLGKTEN